MNLRNDILQELRKYFKRGTPSQILITLFNDEFEFFKDSQMSGMIVLKFKIPYKGHIYFNL